MPLPFVRKGPFLRLPTQSEFRAPAARAPHRHVSPETPLKAGEDIQNVAVGPSETALPGPGTNGNSSMLLCRGVSPAPQARSALPDQLRTKSGLWTLYPASPGVRVQPDRWQAGQRPCPTSKTNQKIRNCSRDLFTFPGHPDEFWRLAKAGEGGKGGNLIQNHCGMARWPSPQFQAAGPLL